MIDKLFEIGLLYDFYSELLTPHQKDICRLYFEDNYTLGEIADETGISRQAVHDTVSRSERSLRGYEEKLGLAKRFRRREEEIAKAAAAVDHIIDTHKDDAGLISELGAVKKILARIED